MNVIQFFEGINGSMVKALDQYSKSLLGVEEENINRFRDIFGPELTTVLDRIRKDRLRTWERTLDSAIEATPNVRDSEDLRRHARRAGSYIHKFGPTRFFYEKGKLTDKVGGDRVEIIIESKVIGLFPVYINWGVQYEASNPHIPPDLRANGPDHENRILDYIQQLEGSDSRLKGYIHASELSLQKYPGHLAYADKLALDDLTNVSVLCETRQDKGVVARKTNIMIGNAVDEAINKIIQVYLSGGRV